MRVYFISLFVISSFSLKAQERIDLNEAKNILLETNIKLKQSELKEKIAEINYIISQNDITPTIQLNANNQTTMGLVFDQVSGKLITGNQWTNYANATISSSVVLFSGFGKLNSIRSEKINHEISNFQTDKLERDLEIEMVGLFFQSLINRDLHYASKEQLKFSTQQVAQLGEEVELGKRTLIDVAQAKSKEATDKLNTVTSMNAYEATLLKLKQILEISLEEDIELVAPNTHVSYGITEDIFLNDNDPDLMIISKQVELSDIQLKLEKSKYFPTISFNTGYGTNFSSQRFLPYSNSIVSFIDQINQNRSFYATISLTLPIYDGFKTKANIKRANINKQILSLEKKSIEKEKLKMYSEAILEYRSAKEELIAINASFEANKINFDAINVRYELGKSSSIELFKALTDLNLSEFNLISKKYNLMYRYEILKLLKFDFFNAQ